MVSERVERGILIAILVMFCLFMFGAAKWSCEAQNECLQSKCASGLSPVWVRNNALCMCVEVPK